MTDSGKAFLEKVTADEALQAELNDLLKDVDNAEKVSLIIEFAKKKGFALTEEDIFQDDAELSESELETVSGGGGCGCMVAGGGGGDGLKCGCFMGGVGFIKNEPRASQGFCFCAGNGAGATRRH